VATDAHHAPGPGLEHRADRELARRTLRVAFMYVPLAVLLTGVTDLRRDVLAQTGIFTSVMLGAGWLRLRLCKKFDAVYAASPARWRRDNALLTVLISTLWGLGMAAVVVRYGLDWTTIACLMATVGIGAGSVSSLSPRLHLFQWFVSTLLLPGATVFITYGRGDMAAMGVLVVVYWVQLLILGRFFSTEFMAGKLDRPFYRFCA